MILRPTVLLFNVFLMCTFSSRAASESLGLESKFFVTVLLRAHVKTIIIIIKRGIPAYFQVLNVIWQFQVFFGEFIKKI
jgi:hypothetical protein